MWRPAAILAAMTEWMLDADAIEAEYADEAALRERTSCL
jgi:hypothetical protein